MSKDTTPVAGNATVEVSTEARKEAQANSGSSALITKLTGRGVQIGEHSLLDFRDMQCQWDDTKPVGEQGSLSLWSTGTQVGTYKDKNGVDKKAFGYRPVPDGGMMQLMYFVNGDQLCREVAELQGLEEIPRRKATNKAGTASGGIPS